MDSARRRRLLAALAGTGIAGAGGCNALASGGGSATSTDGSTRTGTDGADDESDGYESQAGPDPDEPPYGYEPGTKLVTGYGEPVPVAGTLPRDEFETLDVYPAGLESTRDDKSRAVLVRFPEELYGAGTNHGALVDGNAAFSAVCTHLGCTADETRSHDGRSVLHCPCHSEQFDPLSGAKPVFDVAPRPLPELPLGTTTEGGRELLIATGPFRGPVGPDA
jgi:Rieske Fe-S protein